MICPYSRAALEILERLSRLYDECNQILVKLDPDTLLRRQRTYHRYRIPRASGGDLGPRYAT
jgi:hypothetical protein